MLHLPAAQKFSLLLSLVIGLALSQDAGAIGGDVLTSHNDLANTGQYLTEPLLSATNVNSSNFGKLFSFSVDGQVYTQPLYKSGVNITSGSYQGTRNVVFIATEHNSLYAFDAEGSTGSNALWQTSFINPANNVTTVPSSDVNSDDLNPEIGITGTPVIDPSSNTLFLCAKTKEIISGSNHYILRLHAIDIGSGAEKPGSPTLIADTISDLTNYTFVSGPTVSGAGAGSVGGTVTFNALRQNQRCGLSLVNGVVYMGSASHGDNPPYHGWVLGFSATTYQITAAWNADPNGNDTGIWMSGGRLSTDSSGNLYFLTGNGTFTQPTYDSTTGSYINGSYGSSIVRLAPDTLHTSSSNQNTNGWGLKVVTYFTAFNQSELSDNDLDVGSGAALLLPDSAGSGAHPHLLVGAGKEGRLYMVDRDSMGLYNSGTDQIVQEQANALGGCFSSPAYFNGAFYMTPSSGSDSGKVFTIANGTFTSSFVSTPDSFGFPGASPCISGTGATDPNAIVWCLDGGRGSNQLRAYKAAKFSTEIYTTAQAANNRDQIGTACKFALPTIANTRVYVPTTNGLIVYGLLNPNPWPGATAFGDGWESSSWFGSFNVNSYPWIYHAQHGWMYVFGNNPASIWLYNESDNMGFLWTSSTVYPWLWSNTEQTWLYYVTGSQNPRWFFNWSTQQWEQHTP